MGGLVGIVDAWRQVRKNKVISVHHAAEDSPLLLWPFNEV